MQLVDSSLKYTCLRWLEYKEWCGIRWRTLSWLTTLIVIKALLLIVYRKNSVLTSCRWQLACSVVILRSFLPSFNFKLTFETTLSFCRQPWLWLSTKRKYSPWLRAIYFSKLNWGGFWLHSCCNRMQYPNAVSCYSACYGNRPNNTDSRSAKIDINHVCIRNRRFADLRLYSYQ